MAEATNNRIEGIVERSGAAASSQAAKKAAQLEQIIRLANERIDAIRMNPMLSASEKEALIARIERAITSGDAKTITGALINIAVEQNWKETHIEVEAIALNYMISQSQAQRVLCMSKPIDINDMASISRYADAFVDADLPAELREAQKKLLAHALQKDTVQVAIHNAAQPSQRADHAAKWLKAQSDFNELVRDDYYKDIADIIKRADRVGLEALPHVQELLQKAKNHEISPELLAKELTLHTTAQHKKLGVLARELRADLSEETQAILNSIGEGEDKGSNKAIFKLARAVIEEKRFERMTPEEKAAIQLYTLSRDKAVFKVLGDNAFVASYGLERVTGTAEELEQRTDRAMKALREHMSPELTELAGRGEKYLRERVRESLINADESKIPISEIDTLTGKQLSAFSSEVTKDTIAALRLRNMDALRAAEKAMAPLAAQGVKGGEHADTDEKAALVTTAVVTNPQTQVFRG